MRRITQLKRVREYLKSFSLKALKATDVEIKKGDSIIVLPYDLNLYDEIESLFIRKQENNYFIIEDKASENKKLIEFSLETIKKYTGTDIPLEEVKNRIVILKPVFIDKDSLIFSLFVNITNLERKLSSEIVEIDLPVLENLYIGDLKLLFMISVLSTVVY